MKTVALTLTIFALSAFSAQAQYYDYGYDNYYYQQQQEAQEAHERFVESNNAWGQQMLDSAIRSTCDGGRYDYRCHQ